jgi:hypothetical protein
MQGIPPPSLHLFLFSVSSRSVGMLAAEKLEGKSDWDQHPFVSGSCIVMLRPMSIPFVLDNP